MCVCVCECVCERERERESVGFPFKLIRITVGAFVELVRNDGGVSLCALTLCLRFEALADRPRCELSLRDCTGDYTKHSPSRTNG